MGLLNGIIDEAIQPDDPQPPLNEEHAEELAATIQLAADYRSMMAMPAWKALEQVFKQIEDDAIGILRKSQNANQIIQAQAAITTVEVITDHITGLVNMGIGAQSHKAGT
jgi:hypothetical protein